MKRDRESLARKEYDLVIVGGGIFGICAAWDAALRGLSVALLERGDFSQAASANCFKMVHGGIRYLQHADLTRIRESSQERNLLLRIAPHLVHPLPIVIPTYGHGLQSKELLCAGLSAYGLITLDRNRGIGDPVKRVPLGNVISRDECLRRYPGLKPEGLTGGVTIYDGQMYSPSRIAISFLRSAAEAGAVTLNYVEATSFLHSKAGQVKGVAARDLLNGDNFTVHGKVVLNAAGAWAERLLRDSMNVCITPQATFSRDVCFVVPRHLAGNAALAVQGTTRDPDAILSRKQRHLFIVPWREYTLIGVWHMVYAGAPDACSVSEDDLRQFIDEINDAYPPLALKREDVLMWNSGLVLFGENKPGAMHLSYGKRSRIIDHAQAHGIDGLITLIGVRYTTARREAQRAVDLAISKIGIKTRSSSTALTPIFGGEIVGFEDFMRDGLASCPTELGTEARRALLRNYGSKYTEVLKYRCENPRWVETIAESTVTKAEVVHAVREEMAEKLADVILRRTELGTAGHPGGSALKACAKLMASELGWNESRIRNEVQEVERFFSLHGSRNSSAGEALNSGARLQCVIAV
jgi:glycerol-3-phosphate dehydrogenase